MHRVFVFYFILDQTGLIKLLADIQDFILRVFLEVWLIIAEVIFFRLAAAAGVLTLIDVSLEFNLDVIAIPSHLTFGLKDKAALFV